MDIDGMNPDELRRACRDLLRENETLRRRLHDEDAEAWSPSPFAVVVGHMLDGLTPNERDLAVSLAGAIR
jgi:hypothetical protein